MKKKHNRKKMMILSIIIIIVLLIVFIIGIISGFDFNKLMGNSLTKTYYYCEDSNFTLKGEYCYKTNYTAPVLMGDANKDGTINVLDVTEIHKYIKNMVEFDEVQLIVADLNNDGVVNNDDAAALQRAIANLYNSYGTVGGTVGTFYTVGKDKFCPKNYHLIRNETTCSYKQVIKAKKEEFIYGDINSDKVIDEKDASLLQQYISGLKDFTKVQKEAGDVNKDGIINVLDITALNDIIQKNNRASVSAEVLMLNKIDINNVVANTIIEYQAKFKVENNKQYYYKWYDVKSPAKTLETECKLVTNNASDTYKVEATDNNEYVLLKLYSDKDCANQINMYKSQEIKIKEEESTVSLDYKLLSPILTSNIVNKNTNLTFYAVFKVTGNKKYYYKWNVIKDSKVYNKSGCNLIKDGMTTAPTIIINGKDQHGTWEIYSDSSCEKESLVQTYSTDNYNYIADSISLNIKSTRLTTGNSLKLQATINSNLPNVYSLIKWTSSNNSVAIVDNNGNVTAKSKGSVTITANVGGMSATADITVVDAGNDTSIACPLIEYEKSEETTNFTITPDSNISKYDIYLSTNNHVGTYANYELILQNVTGVQSVNNYYKNAYSNQAKIVVYSPSGTSRNCYTPPLTWKWNTVSILASCPNMTYSYENKDNANIYEYKNGDNTVNSGVSKMHVSYKTDVDYQYSWYTLQEDGSYRLFKTYKTNDLVVKTSVTGQLYDRNGQVVVTDRFGNNIVCQTDYINAVNLVKSQTGVGGTDIYYESNYPSSDYNTVVSEMKKLYNESPSYLAASKIFLYSENTYVKRNGNSCGVYILKSNTIDIRESKYACGGSSSSSYFKGAVKHELGHSVDSMNRLLSGTSLSDLNYSNKNLMDYTSKYENKKLCGNNYCLRYNGNYSYGTSYWEFMADLFSYDSFNFNINNELLDLRKQMLDIYLKNYNNSKSKFNELKENLK